MISLLGIPYDLSSSFLRGAALAPPRIRQVWRDGSANDCAENGLDVASVIADKGDLQFSGNDIPAIFDQITDAVGGLLNQGNKLICLGGDHSITYPIVRAYAGVFPPFHILHMDAHADLYDEFEGDKLSHACPFARIMEKNLASKITQVGIRTLNAHQRAQAERFGVEIIEMKNWRPDSLQHLSEPVYLSIDLDALDPAFAPGVSHHEPGGFTMRELLGLIQSIPTPLIGADIVEYNPVRDVHDMTAMAAFKVLKEVAAKMCATLLLLLLFAFPAFGQNSTFDTDNEGWATAGDATSPNATWIATGGQAGGYIRVTDASTGGTWQFVAPAKFRGIKCDAYGKYLRYDQFVSSNAEPNNAPDVTIEGTGGVRLVIDNPVLPGTDWTHFDLLLREDGGWRLNNLNGPVPTEAQFRQVLANVTSLRIRGEYFAFADDFGGLDNVLLESDFHFAFDLDGDDSSGATGGDFQIPPTCTPAGQIADDDALLTTEARVDSITIRVLNGTVTEELVLDALPPNIGVYQPSPGSITLVNEGSATLGDFLLALRLMHYYDLSPDLVTGVRAIEIRVFTDCGAVGATRRAYLPIVAQPDAGENGDTVLCPNSPLLDLRTALRGGPDANGRWEPLLASGSNFFDPKRDTSGLYAYIVPEAEPCPGDTAFVRVEVEPFFPLRPDTTICYDDTLTLQIPPNLLSWEWGDGSHRVELSVTSPDTYTLTGQTKNCLFSDSVRVSFYTCEPCLFYAPNVFSPNDDGVHDGWHIFLPCLWQRYRLEIYDRWGGLVFAANDPETVWDGFVRGREPAPGVYVWIVEWTGELFGKPKVYRGEGDVTVVR